MAPAIGNVYRLSCIGDYNATNLAIITLHFKCIGSGAEVASLCSGVRANLLYPSAGELDSTFYWRQINALTVNKTPPEGESYTTGFPIQGSLVSGEALPYMCAAVVKIATGYAGRSYRGRNYFPGLSETGQADSTIASAVKTLLQGCYDDLLALYGAGGTDANWQWVVWSQKLSAGTTVTDAIVRDLIGTQRRRRPGVGA